MIKLKYTYKTRFGVNVLHIFSSKFKERVTNKNN